MAKKKKTQLKPVARGFATISVPKKAAPPEKETETVTDLVGDVEEDAGRADVGPISSSGAASVQSQIDEFDPEKVEEQSLQNLVDRLQSTTEKDIVRTVKVQSYTLFCGLVFTPYTKAVESDRRFSKTLPNLDLDPVLIHRILAMAAESDLLEGMAI